MFCRCKLGVNVVVGERGILSEHVCVYPIKDK